MNRMWVRFGLTFGLFSLLGPMVLVTLGFLSLQSGVIRAFIRTELNADGSLVDQMVSYYQKNHNWDGIEDLITSYDNQLPGSSGEIGFELYFTDEGHTVFYGSDAAQNVLSQDDGVREVLAISVDGRTRGYLSIVQIDYQTIAHEKNGEPRSFFVGQVSGALTTLGLYSAIFGLVVGLVVSRILARPLADLADTARRLGKRDFTARAEVKGSDELQEVAKAFNDMAQGLDQAETFRRNLVADVAHELRTPLTVLQANLQALADGIYPMTTDEVQRLLTQTKLLTHLVGELRELSLAEARQLSLECSAINVLDLICHTATAFQSAADQQGVTLVVNTTHPVTVKVDSERMQQVLHNLTHNALTHTPKGGIISFGATTIAGAPEITVSDTGSGIAPEHLPHIFDRFYRADKSRSRETGGTGLGLAIAKAIVELHGGQILVKSSGIAGEGTTFTLRFSP